MKIKAIIALSIFTLYLTYSKIIAEEIKIEKADDIKALIILTGADKFINQILSKAIINYQFEYPEVKDTHWKEFMDRINSNELLNLVIPIYDKHFTHDEIKQLVSFYGSPVGKKISNLHQGITTEIYTAGMQWLKKATKKIEVTVQDENIKKIDFRINE